MLLEKCSLGELLSILDRVANVDVVEKNILLHGPDLETDGTHWLKVGWGLVLEVGWVLDLLWLPDTLVGWVIYVWGSPLALVGWVADGWL